MLVLSRQRDETIMIGDEIEITVVDIRGDKVRLGIAAPTRIAVHRKEVYEAIKRENEQAAQLGTQMGAGELDVIRRTISPGPAKNRSRSAVSSLAAPVGPAPGGPTRSASSPLPPGERNRSPDGRQTA
jgi:carbon storage regulator